MRHKKAEKRDVRPDYIYQSKLVTKFINRLMKDGKKTTAERVFYGAMDIIAEKETEGQLAVFEAAINNVGPKTEVKARRVGGASYQVPQEVRGERRVSLAIRWIVEGATARPNSEFRSYSAKLAAELLDAYKNEGAAVRKRDNVLRMAEANRAFAHFRY